MAYASYSDYEARYGTLTQAQQALVTVKLGDAATILNGFINVDPADADLMDRLNMVSCAMVNRAMLAEADSAIGISNTTYTMGPFSQSATFANPSGDLYLTKLEKELLGVGGGGMRSIRPVIGGQDAQ